MKVNSIVWYIKQLFPLLYVSEYQEMHKTEDGFEPGEKKLCIWRMWFGRSFHIKRYTLAA